MLCLVLLVVEPALSGSVGMRGLRLLVVVGAVVGLASVAGGTAPGASIADLPALTTTALDPVPEETGRQ